jgi:L-lactate utilization protein LutC
MLDKKHKCIVQTIDLYTWIYFVSYNRYNKCKGVQKNMKQNQKLQTINWNNLADDLTIEKTISALNANGINAHFAANETEARNLIFSLIPKGSEVFTATSVTLDSLGISKDIQESKYYISVRNKLNSLDRNKDQKQMQTLGAVPEYVIGSVHAVTQDGKVVIASATGSQLPSYSYGANHVIWVVGTQKIVKDLDEAINRVYEHVLPLESERAKKAYGVPGSVVAKLLIFNKEVNPNRINLVFVNKELGY